MRTRIGHYRILETVGQGGMGVVYRAQDSRLHRDVALKVLSEGLSHEADSMARFQREARMLAALDHPHVAAIHSLEVIDGEQVLVMEFVPGRTLESLLAEGPLAPERLVPLARQIAEGLRAAHRAGIIHRDLKPSNVMITPRGGVKLLDFGLARMLEPRFDPEGSHVSTASLGLGDSGVAGTVAYMAPEQVRGEDVSERTDIYAFGVMLYRMATGVLPYEGASTAQIVGEIQYREPPHPRWRDPSIPQALETVVLRCLSKDPNHRYPSMDAVLSGLADAGPGSHGVRRSLAVLYFENLSPAREDEHFRDGITEDVIIELSRISALSVLSRSSVLAFRDRSVSANEIGRTLGVDYVLEGSVRRVGNHLRIGVELVESANGRSVWAERYDRQVEDVFAIQDEIARSIARTLEVMLTEEEKQALAAVPTTDVEAYDYYLRGRHHFQQFRRRSIEFARELFAAAIEIDPRYARAHAGLADCNSYLYMFWEAAKEYRAAAEAASRRAVELAPDLAEAHVARGVAISLGEENEDAGAEFQRAIELDPNRFEAYYFHARALYAWGHREEAVRRFEQASRARPEDYQSPMLEASALRGLGRTEEARVTGRKALELARKHLELNPGDTRALYFSAIALCHLGEREEQALEWAGRALAMDPEEPQVQYNVACVYALLGKREEALGCLRAVIAQGDWWRTWMSHDPDLASLEDDPRYRELVGRGA